MIIIARRENTASPWIPIRAAARFTMLPFGAHQALALRGSEVGREGVVVGLEGRVRVVRRGFSLFGSGRGRGESDRDRVGGDGKEVAGIPYSDMLVVTGRANQVRHQCYMEQAPAFNLFKPIKNKPPRTHGSHSHRPALHPSLPLVQPIASFHSLFYSPSYPNGLSHHSYPPSTLLAHKVKGQNG